MDEQRACKKCGVPLRFVTGPNGKTIPLDLRAPVYAVLPDLNGEPVAQPAHAYVSHFSTCPAASDFSGKGRAKR